MGFAKYRGLNNLPACSRWIAKSSGKGLDLAIQAERNGQVIKFSFLSSCQAA
jgi:hypothetical protein